MNLAEARLSMIEKWTPKIWWRVFNALVYFDAAHEISRNRYRLRMTQTELAARLNTQQPAIARLERGNMNVSLKYLRRVANAMGCVVRLRIVPLREAIAEEMNEARAKVQKWTPVSSFTVDFSSKHTATYTNTFSMPV
jgi:transcriptional regulator with XRE-family HTH domain